MDLPLIKNVLVLAPHQDDEVIGCGGVIARFVEAGSTVTIQHVFRGNSGVEGMIGQNAAALRHEEASRAATILGCDVLPSLNYADRESIADASVVLQLVRVIRTVRPTFILAPHDEERDVEHQQVARAAVEARWMCSTTSWLDLGVPTQAPALATYEVWSPNARASIAVDISAVLERKRAALRAHASQMKGTSWEDGSIGLSAFRGATMLGRGHAEALALVHAPSALLGL